MVQGDFGVQAVVWGESGLEGEPAGAKVELQARKILSDRRGKEWIWLLNLLSASSTYVGNKSTKLTAGNYYTFSKCMK